MKTTDYFCHKRKGVKKIIFGLLVLTAGVLLLAFKAGMLDKAYQPIVFSWQSLLIALGLINLFDRNTWWLGIILILTGKFFLLPLLFPLPYNFNDMFWPAILILTGTLIIIKKVFIRTSVHPSHRRSEFPLDSGYVTEKNVFGGSEQKIAPCEFKGGVIHNVFSGSEIDLRQTTLAEGKNVLEIKCVFAGITLFVPSDWVIHVDVNSVMGSFSDKRSSVTPANRDSRELYIKGEVVFGGGEIKN